MYLLVNWMRINPRFYRARAGEVIDIVYEYETGDEDSLPDIQTEDAVSDSDPLIIGFIPSILVFVILIALYVGVNGVKH